MASVSRIGSSALRASLRANNTRLSAFQAARCYSAKSQVRRSPFAAERATMLRIYDLNAAAIQCNPPLATSKLTRLFLPRP